MPDTALLISILLFAGLVLSLSGVYLFIQYRSSQQNLVEKIRTGTDKLTAAEKLEASSQNPGSDSAIRKYFLYVIGVMADLIKPKKDDDVSFMRRSLVKAGYRNKHATAIYYGMKIFLAILLPSCYFLYKIAAIAFITANVSIIRSVSEAFPPDSFIIFFIGLALIGFYLPNMWLRIQISNRRRQIFEGLPDALDLMIVCVEAGMGLDAAIARVAKELELSNKAVSEELHMVSLELRAGKLRRDALRNMANRIGLEEVNSLISLLIQTDRFGTSVAQALRVHSDAMRDKRYQRADELAAKLPVKLVFPLVLFIFPSIFVVIAGPAMIRIVRTLFPALSGS